MSVSELGQAILTLAVLILVIWWLRWAWHRFIGMPLDPEVERERLRHDIARSYRLARRLMRWYLHR